ncbi:MAG: glycosyltransferase, partial [Acidimicrobiia bacterium]
YREGWPRSAMEAAAMRLPVVVTDIRGCRQVVEHGTTGFLVPVRDADAMARAVANLASDPGLRADMGAAARRKAEQEFDDQRIIDITLEVYARLLGPRRPTVAA